MTFTKKQSNELTKEWIKALRSGKYKQTQHCLEDKEGNCCLGVGCRVFDKMFPGVLEIEEDKSGTMFNGSDEVLPEIVKKAFRLTSTCGTVWHDGSLSYMNDKQGMNFKEIADIIAAKPPGLFID